MRFHRRPVRVTKLQPARELRGTPTLSERKAWTLLRDRRMLGLKFRRQHVIDGLIVDFYCSDLRLILEVDGGIHEERARSEYDAARTAWLEAKGIEVVRITNDEVSDAKLRRLLTQLLGRSPSPQCGEGERG